LVFDGEVTEGGLDKAAAPPPPLATLILATLELTTRDEVEGEGGKERLED
jgi:hypothetical protein